MFRRKERVPEHRRHEWLPETLDGLVWRLELSGVIDPLDADALWDTTSGGGAKILEVISQVPDRRLRRALEDHRRWRKQTELLKGKQTLVGQCFTDIIVEVPQHVWGRNLRNGGVLIEMLAHNLRFHHQRDLQQSLPKARPPRYLVRPNPNLAQDRVVMLFGPGVYLAALPDEEVSSTPAFEVSPALNDGPLTLPPLQVPYDHGFTRQPVGFYDDQECLVLTPEGQGPFPIPGWKSNQGVYLLLLRVGENEWNAFSTQGQQRWLVRSKPLVRGVWRCELRDTTDDQAPVLSVELRPQSQAQPSPAATFGYTLMPGFPSPVSPYFLELEGVVLPRLLGGLRQWTLWLEPGVGLASPELIAQWSDRLTKLRLDMNGLWLMRPDQSSLSLGSAITAPLEVDGEGSILEPFSDFVGFLRLPRADAYPLEAGQSRSLGRFDPDNPPASPDIILDQLAQPGGLLWAGPNPGYTLGNLRLSRRQARLCVEQGVLQVKPEPSSQGQLLAFDAGMQLIQAAGGEFRLQPGQRLLAGNYLLRFQTGNAM